MDDSEKWRLFVALRVPDPVKDEIEKAQSELQEALSKSAVRWTRREQFHLTLQFLGDVPATRFGALESSVRSEVSKLASIRLVAEGLGVFPDLRRPRVVWVGVGSDGPELPTLFRAVRLASTSFSAESPDEKPVGHVTLGRIKDLDRTQSNSLKQAVSSMSKRRFGNWIGNHVEILRSELSPTGAVHHVMAVVPLSKPDQA